MVEFWKKAVSVTGPVAVVCFVLAMVANRLFEDKVLEYFGGEKSFYIAVAILAILGIALVLSIMVYKSSPVNAEVKTKSVEENKTASITNSEIKGDIVFGDKHVNQGSKHDE